MSAFMAVTVLLFGAVAIVDTLAVLCMAFVAGISVNAACTNYAGAQAGTWLSKLLPTLTPSLTRLAK